MHLSDREREPVLVTTYCYTDILVSLSTGVLAYWRTGILVYWQTGIHRTCKGMNTNLVSPFPSEFDGRFPGFNPYWPVTI